MSAVIAAVSVVSALARAAASAASALARAVASALSPAATNAVVAICVELLAPAAVGAVGTPVSAGDARGALSASALVIVVAKFGSLPNAAASSLSVSSAAGDEATSAAIAL